MSNRTNTESRIRAELASEPSDWDTPGPYDYLYAAIDELWFIAMDQDTADRATTRELVELHAGLVEIRDRIVAERRADQAAA